MELTDAEVKEVGRRRVAEGRSAYKILIPIGIGIIVAIFIAFIKEVAQTSSGRDVLGVFTSMALFGGIGWSLCLLLQLSRRGNKAAKDFLEKYREEEHKE